MLGGLTRIVLAALLLPALARGATFVVNTTADAVDATPGDGTCATSAGACSLRAAVQEANALAGQDAITVPAGVFRLTLTGAGEDAAATGDLDVTEALAVTGAGSDGTVIDGAGSDRVFHVVGGSGLALANLTIRNGDAGGAPGGGVWSAVPGAGLGVTNVVFAGNHAATGGAVFANDALSMSGSTFTDQVAGEGGAVVAAGSGAVAIDACRFASNFASGSGGGVRVQTTADVTVTNTSFADNFATSGGGGMFVQTSANLLVSGGDFTGNTGLGSGGGLVFQGQAASALTVSGTAFRGNRTLGPGGALASTAGGAASLGNVELSGSHAALGGGAYVTGQSGLAIAGCRFFDNATTNGPGGGLFDAGAGDTIVTGSLFADNVAEGAPGGGIYRSAGGGLQLQASTLARNVSSGSASGLGGGLYLASAGPSSLVDTTLSGNVADLRGGAIFPASALTVVSSTLFGNEAVVAGGAIFAPGPTVTLTNTIVAGSTVQPACSGTITSNGGNLDADGSCALAGLGDLAHVDPLLAPLDDAAVPTHALLPGSPAIDAANSIACPAVDERGVPRISDGNGDGVAACDIGAYEYVDQCPSDPAKTLPGVCGCGVPDVDANGNGVLDCLVDAELKARLAQARTLVNGLTGKKDASQKAAAAAIDALAEGVVQYVGGLAAEIHLTDPNANLGKLAATLQRAVHRAGRARKHALRGARKRALAAIDALDAAVVAD